MPEKRDGFEESGMSREVEGIVEIRTSTTGQTAADGPAQEARHKARSEMNYPAVSDKNGKHWVNAETENNIFYNLHNNTPILTLIWYPLISSLVVFKTY